MNVYFAYTAGGPSRIFYGKYFGFMGPVTESDIKAAIYPTLKDCHMLESVADITISIFSGDTVPYSDRDQFKYDVVFCSPGCVYFNGVLQA
jgi:hypothetical protein